MKPELRFEQKKMRAANLGNQSSVPDLLGELVLQNHLEFRLDEEDEIYEGYGRRPNAYPYRQYNNYTRVLSEKEVKTAVLENKYIKAVFLLEYGGRLWELWDKQTDKNLLYTNDVLRFSNLAVRNAWFSGGVEWNIGIIGHTPFTTDPLYTARTETNDGDPVLRMYEYERIRGITYQMDFWLEKESKVLNCRMRVMNETEEVIPMYWWSNIAVEEYEGGRIIVPANKAFTYADGAVFKVDIPMVDGIDITDYRQIKKSVDYFFDIPEECPKYIANVDRTGYGLLQVSTKRLRSRKLFCWGNQDASDHWQEFLTDKAGRYIEIQAGLGKTQYGCLPMAPHTTWEWMEQYGAVQVSKEILEKEHDERAKSLTEKLYKEQIWENLEQTLKKTKSMARKKAQLVMEGSGYGALNKRGNLTKHLEFCLKDDTLRDWQKFFKTSKLHCPDPMQIPDQFLIDENHIAFLKESITKENKENWYAYYQLGLGYYTQGKYKKAKKELNKSLVLAENPWALHALSCTALLMNDTVHASEYCVKGMRMRPSDQSYLKEGFKILSLCKADKILCDFYEAMDSKEQQIQRIRFYYISALHRLGKDEKAYQLLEQNGGIELEDIREGEDSIAQLWSELYQNLYGKKEAIPHKYNFKAY